MIEGGTPQALPDTDIFQECVKGLVCSHEESSTSIQKAELTYIHINKAPCTMNKSLKNSALFTFLLEVKRPRSRIYIEFFKLIFKAVIGLM